MYVPRRCLFFLVLCCFIFSRTGEVLGSRNDFKVNSLNSPFPWKNDKMFVFWPCCECDCGIKINVLMYSTNQKDNCRVKVCFIMGFIAVKPALTRLLLWPALQTKPNSG